MTKPLLLPVALAALLLALPEAPAQAQGVSNAPANTRAARRAREQAKAPAAEAKQNYPKATRVAPKQVGEPALQKRMEALLALQGEEGGDDKIIAKAGEILADDRANAYDKSSAAYLAGSAWQSKSTGDYSEAIKSYVQAIESNGLSNNNHYLAMLQVAQLLNADGKQEEALKWIDRFLSETQSDDKTALGVKNQILMSMDKPELALPYLEKEAAANPGDTKLQMNLASLYLQAEQEAKALAILDRLRKEGKLTETSHYEAVWRLLANTEGRQKEAIAVIDEGLQKGLLKPSYDLYTFQAQTWYGDDDMPRAIAAWTKAAPLGKDGQGYLNLAQGQQISEHWAEARAAAKTALEKGIRQPGQAWRVISIAEISLGNKSAGVAAAREAAKYPDTKKWADATIKANGGK
jgi:hypothetical protein